MFNYKYKLKRLTTGRYYIVREMSKRGFKKWQAGKLQNGSGVISIRLRHKLLLVILIIATLFIISALLGGCDNASLC